MRDADDNTRAALRGSRSGDELICWVWYDGALAYPDPLPVSDWSLGWDGSDSQKVPGTLSIDVADPDGTLGPWLYNDPLGVGGSQIQVFYKVGDAGEVPIGWYRITSNGAKESWVFRVAREDGWVEPDSAIPPHQRIIAQPMGSQISVTAQDLTEMLDADEFLAPEQPSGSPTVLGEITRLVGDTMPVAFEGLTDEPLPAGTTWDENRMEAIMDLLAMVGGSFRLGSAGDLVCYRKTTEPAFRCGGGPEGILINLSRSQSLDGVANLGVVTSSRKETIDGRETEIPITGSYEVDVGPLRVGGPFGRRVIRNGNPLMNTQAKADQAAESLVMNRLNAQKVVLEVYCLPDPTVEVGDYGVIATPVIDGRSAELAGEVVSVDLSGTADTVSQMKLSVACLLTEVASALKGISLDPYLTGTSPDMTYDNVNPLRTTDQMGQTTDEV